MAYHRQFYAPMGAAPGMTPTNAEKAAIAAFQASMGIKADGIIGPATVAAMAKVGMTLADVYAGKQPSAAPAAPASRMSTGKLLLLGALGVGAVIVIRRSM